MEHGLACKLAGYLCKHNIIKEEYYDVYVYGAELLFSFLITNLIIISIGLAVKRIVFTVVYLVVFIALRRFTGGFHADTHLKCKITMIAVYLASLACAEFLRPTFIWFVIVLIIGNIVIWFLAPIENPNKPIAEQSRLRLKIISHVLYSLLLSIGGVFNLIDNPLGNMILFTLVSIIALMFVTIKTKGESKNEGTHN